MKINYIKYLTFGMNNCIFVLEKAINYLKFN